MFRRNLAVLAIVGFALLSSLAPASAGSGFSRPGMTAMTASCTGPEFGSWSVEAKIVYDIWRRPNLPAIDTNTRLSDVTGYYRIEGWSVAPVGEIWAFGYNPNALVPSTLLVYISPPTLLGLVNTEAINAVLSGPYGQTYIDGWWVDSDREGECRFTGNKTTNLNAWTSR